MLLALLLCVSWEGLGNKQAAVWLGIRWKDILEARRWLGPFLSTESTHCSLRVREYGQLSVVLTRLLEQRK